MKTTTRLVARSLGFILLAAGVATSTEAGPRQPVPHSGGAAPRATAPAHHGGSAPRTAPPRGHPPPRGTSNGVAHYGYGYGYGGSYWGGYPYWGGYGYWGGYYPYWDVGWGVYGGWGGYGYAAYAPGYGPYDGTYIVSVEAQPPRGPAIVETGVSPSKAEVVLDGDTVGFASDYSGRWDRLTLVPGPHTITFQKKGYRTLVIAFEARPGATYVFNDALVSGEGEDRRTLPAAVTAAPPETREPISAAAATGRLRVRAEPGDAAVYLDGEYLGLGAELGRIHAALAVATGTHHLEAVRPGYVSVARTIEVREADLTAIELTLEPER